MPDYKAIQQLDLNLLKVFESLYLEQNMTRTAKALHITPSAVSHAIKRLRECLGDPLFQRSQNKMLPTAACQRMAPLIIDNLSRLRQILQQWGEFDPIHSQHHFHLGMHEALEISVVPLLVTRLAQIAPKVTFSSIKVNRTQLLSDLASGHIDLALDVSLPVKPPVHYHKLLDDGFCVLARAGHPLAKTFCEQAYFSASHVSVSTRPHGLALEDMLFQEQGMSRHIAVRCQNFYAAKAVLQGSEHLLTLPRQMSTQLCNDGSLIDLIAGQPALLRLPTVATQLYWHENTQHDAALGWLRNVMIELFKQARA